MSVASGSTPRESSKTALNELLGRDVTLDFYVVFDPELNIGLKYEDLSSTLESSNPQLLAARYEMNAARLAEKELFGERIPEIGFNMGYNYAKSNQFKNPPPDSFGNLK